MSLQNCTWWNDIGHLEAISIDDLSPTDVGRENAWAQLFKTNDIVSQGDVKISNVNISNMPIFFVEKMCTAKASLIFSTKNISGFGYKVLKHLTS